MKESMEKKNEKKISVRDMVIPGILVFLVIFFSLTTDSFLTVFNIRNIFIQISYILILGVGVCFIMIGGGVDLSIGYQVALTSVMSGVLMVNMGMSMYAAIPLLMLLGVVMGFLNGIIVVKLKVFPMIITLATSYVFQGAAYWITDAAVLRGFENGFIWLGQGYVWEIPVCLLIAIVFLVVGTIVLRKTYFGQYIYALGGNADAAHMAGVNINKYRVLTYVIGGFCAACAGIILSARSACSSANLGPGAEFTALTAGIIGGISFQGGEGNISGMVIGVILLQVLKNGMQLIGLGSYPQYIAQGCVLVFAVGFDYYQKTRKARDAKLLVRQAKESNAS